MIISIITLTGCIYDIPNEGHCVYKNNIPDKDCVGDETFEYNILDRIKIDVGVYFIIHELSSAGLFYTFENNSDYYFGLNINNWLFVEVDGSWSWGPTTIDELFFMAPSPMFWTAEPRSTLISCRVWMNQSLQKLRFRNVMELVQTERRFPQKEGFELLPSGKYKFSQPIWRWTYNYEEEGGKEFVFEYIFVIP